MSEARALLRPRHEADPHAYAGRPVKYAEEVLGIRTLTDDQKCILELLHQTPCRVLVPSGHNTGKTHVSAIALSYWYDSFNPGAIFTIGPRFDSLKDTVWGEVRRQRARAGLPDEFIGPQAPEMRSATDHWAKAFTAAKDSSLTGRHLPRMLFIVEEACGVDPIWWEVIMTMFDPGLGHAQLCIFNPTDSTSQAYQEDLRADDAGGQPRWHRVRLNALNHPNVLAELRGEPKPIPHAVSLDQVNGEVRHLCEPVEDMADVRSTDLEWPPGSGRWYRPGPVFQARWLGLWPDQGCGVWSPALWAACFPPAEPAIPLCRLPEVGVDCSMGRGEDFFALHARWGPVSLYHETSNVMDCVRIFARVKEACRRMAGYASALRPPAAEPARPQRIRVKIDDDGTGNAVAALLKREGYSVALVSAATSALHPDLYPRLRDEAWFMAAEKAKAGLVYVGRLDRTTLARLRQQLLAPAWEVDSAGRRAVEKKDETKDKIGRSPDDADAFNLAYLETGELSHGPPVENPQSVQLGPYQVPVATGAPAREPFTPPEDDDRPGGERPRLYGRR